MKLFYFISNNIINRVILFKVYEENDENALIRNLKFNNWMTLIKSIEYKDVFDEIESIRTELILSVKYRVVN
jgi:hypothetical protein